MESQHLTDAKRWLSMGLIGGEPALLAASAAALHELRQSRSSVQ